jgi:hypothetical protein
MGILEARALLSVCRGMCPRLIGMLRALKAKPCVQGISVNKAKTLHRYEVARNRPFQTDLCRIGLRKFTSRCFKANTPAVPCCFIVLPLACRGRCLQTAQNIWLLSGVHYYRVYKCYSRTSL